MGRTLIIRRAPPQGGWPPAGRSMALLHQCDRLVVNGDLAELHHPGLAAELGVALASCRRMRRRWEPNSSSGGQP